MPSDNPAPHSAAAKLVEARSQALEPILVLKLIAAIGAIQVAVVLANILRSKLTALLLGPEGVGIISIIDQSVQVALQLCIFSLPFVAVKFLSRSHSRGFDALQHSYVNFLKLIGGLALAGTALSLSLALWWPELLGLMADYQPFFIVAVLSLPAIALMGFMRNVLAAIGRPRTAALFDAVVAASIAMAVAVGMLVAGVLGYYSGHLVAGVAVVAGALIYMRRCIGLRLTGPFSNLGREFRDNPGIATFALINYVISFSTPLAFLVARYAVLDNYDEAVVGMLQAAYAISLVLQLLLNPANGLYLTPIVNRDIPVVEKLVAVTEFQRKLMPVVAVLAMPMVLFPEWLLYVFYSSEFLDAAPALFLFVVTQAIFLQAGIYQALMIGLDRLKVYGIIMVLAQAMIAAGAWLLVPEYGISGVAFGLLLSSMFVLVFTLSALRLSHGLLIPARTQALALYVLVMLALAGEIAAGYGLFDLVAIAAKVAFYGLFALSVLFLFLDRAERAELRRRSEGLLKRPTVNSNSNGPRN